MTTMFQALINSQNILNFVCDKIDQHNTIINPCPFCHAEDTFMLNTEKEIVYFCASCKMNNLKDQIISLIQYN